MTITEKVKTRELIGAALDWAVAKCEELPIRHDPMGFKAGSEAGYWIWPDTWPPKPGYAKIGRPGGYSPSTNWSQGGPIIEREAIQLTPYSFGESWLGRFPQWRDDYATGGTTPLIAAMRCYVASKLGEEIDIPEELLQHD